MWMTRYNRNLFDDEWLNDPIRHRECCFQPRADLEKNDNDFRLYLELPGVGKDDVMVEVESDMLKIHGEKKRPEGELESISNERYFGKFVRTFRLGQGVDSENIQVNFEGGVLQVVLPRRDQTRKRRIDIN
jgi:HSP20 family protein